MNANELMIGNFVNVDFNGIIIPAKAETFDDFKNIDLK